MTKSAQRAVLAAALLVASACGASPPAIPLPLHQIADAALGSPTRRFDYASLDPASGRMFIADLAGGRVLVFDVRTNTLVKAIPGIGGAHGVLAVPERGRVYASATATDELVAIDMEMLAVVARSPAGRYPDGIAWAPKVGKLYVSDEHGQTVGVVDAATHRLLTKVAVGGDVGNTQYDAADGLIYSAEQSTNELVAIDPARDVVTGRWPLAGCRGSHGVQLDSSRQLAYVACEDNARLLTFSLAAHKVIDAQAVGDEPDVMAADFGLARLYVASESGVVTMFDISSATPRKVGQAKLADNAHVVAVDPATHRVYFPLRSLLGTPVLRIMAPNVAQ